MAYQPQQNGQPRQQGFWGNNQQQGGAPAQQQQPKLPPGWQLAFAPTGEPYYVDHNSRTTHWSLPAEYQQLNQQQFGEYRGRGGRGGGRGGFQANNGGRGGGLNAGAGGPAGANGQFVKKGIDTGKRKTKMCMNFENGSCAWGDKCAFAHGAHELLATAPTTTAPGAQPQEQH